MWCPMLLPPAPKMATFRSVADGDMSGVGWSRLLFDVLCGSVVAGSSAGSGGDADAVVPSSSIFDVVLYLPTLILPSMRLHHHWFQ